MKTQDPEQEVGQLDGQNVGWGGLLIAAFCFGVAFLLAIPAICKRRRKQ